MDLLKTFGPLLSQVAPTIATALGGPLAGVAVKTLSNALLGHENGTEEEVSAAMQSATPEQLAVVKKIDADFKVRMKELDIDLERISAGDRDSARKMQTQTNDWIPRVLALLITIGFFGILVWMLVHGMPTSGTEALLMMLGALGTAWTGVINFYYGSSAGSKAKNDILAQKEQAK
jgi:membrane-bound ClpP family serine protease